VFVALVGLTLSFLLLPPPLFHFSSCIWQGESLEPPHLHSEEFLEPISRHIAKFHAVGRDLPRPEDPSFVSITRDWFSKVPATYGDERKDRILKELDLSSLKAEYETLVAALLALNSPLVWSHNDLLGPNIVVDRRVQPAPISFIDYEYCSFNSRAFDFANHWCEFAGFELDYSKIPSVETRKRYARHYLEELARGDGNANGNGDNGNGNGSSTGSVTDADVAALVTEATKFMLASHFFWATWGLVQAHVSAIDFDYMDYAQQRYGQYFKTRNELLAFSMEA
jgi:ethanolamine kinase